MSKQFKPRIIGMGKYLPSKILSNQDLEKIVDTTDEWIVSRTGIKERRIAAPQECTSHMGTAAAKAAIANAKIEMKSIDFIVVATVTPDYTSSCTAALVQTQLGLAGVASMDLQTACSGFIYGLAIAKSLVASGMYRHVLLVAAEKMSSFVDYTDRGTCVLFGDGAAAAVISAEGPGLEIGSVHLGADGKYAELVYIPAGGVRHPATAETVENKMHCFKMQGQEVFKLAVRNMCAAAKLCMEEMQLSDDQIRWIVPHQANLRIMEAVAKGFIIPAERMYKTVHKYGNTSASSIPLALEELVSGRQIADGDNILLVAFGAGLTWGAAILTKI